MTIFSRSINELGFATTFQIIELTGDKRSLQLTGRALPYRPLTFSGTMRADVTYYPGNPEPTVQMLGSSEEETTITGMWKDRFLGDGQSHAVVSSTSPIPVTNVGVIGPLLSAGMQTSRTVLSKALDVVKVVDDMRRKGQLVRVSWDEFVREGIITKFEQSWDRRQDVSWSLTFRFINQGDQPASAKVGLLTASPLQFSSLLQSAVELGSRFFGRSVFDRAIVKTRGSTTFIQNKKNLLRDFSNQLSAQTNPGALFVSSAREYIESFSRHVVESRNLLSQGIDGAISKADFTASVLSQMNGTINTSLSYNQKLRSQPLEAYLRRSSSDDKSSLLGKVLSLALSIRGVARQVSRLSGDAAASRAVIRTDLQSTRQGGTGPSLPYIARQGDDLRIVAKITLGNANAWRSIAMYNNLSSSQLEVGQRVYIPPQSYVQANLAKNS